MCTNSASQKGYEVCPTFLWLDFIGHKVKAGRIQLLKCVAHTHTPADAGMPANTAFHTLREKK